MEATTVAAQGLAEGSFDHAGFYLTLSGVSDTPSAAKRLLSESIVELNQTLDTLQETLSFKFVKNSVQTNSNVQPWYEWDEPQRKNVFRGYTISYGVSFKIDDLDLVSRVYDALTSLTTVGQDVRVSVSQPGFSITPRTRERLNKKALKKAWEKVEERFETECGVLGLDPTAFEVATWEVSYSDSNRSNRVSNRMAGAAVAAAAPARSEGEILSPLYDSASLDLPSGDAPILEIQVGPASVTVNLEVGFARRADVKSVKATVVAPGNHTSPDGNHKLGVSY